MNHTVSRRRAIVTAVSVVLIICLVYLTARDREKLTVAEQAVREVFSPVARGASLVSARISSWVSFMISIGEMKQENEALKAQLDTLQAANLALEEAGRENQRLQALLALKSGYQGRSAAAYISYRDPGNWLEAVAIDKGSTSGLANGQAVVNARGVVGRITSVTPHTASVLLAIDSRSSIGGLDARSRDLLIVEGMGDGSGLLLANPLGADSDLAVGDVVITSGLGGVYPKGHVIGDVIWVKQGKYGVSQLAYVRPRVDFQRLEEVLVLIDPIAGVGK